MKKTIFVRIRLGALTLLAVFLISISSFGSVAKKQELVLSGNTNSSSSSAQLSSDDLNYVLAGSTTCTSGLIKPDQYLTNYTSKPQFRPGNTLPKLGQFGWGTSVETAIELATEWNYTLDFGNATSQSVANMSNSATKEGKIIAKAKTDPAKYSLQVGVPRFDTASYPDDIWAHDAKGNLILSGSSKVFSPEASGTSYRQIVEPIADNFRKIAKEAHIALISNGGERDMGVPADQKATGDPKVKAAQGTKSWTDYMSERKAYQESITASAIMNAVPNMEMYLYYYSAAGSTRNYGFWNQYMWNYDNMRGVSTLPNESMYFKQFNGGWIGSESMLTQILNESGRQIQLGQPLSYNWLNGGWWPGVGANGGFGDLPTYQGFLKAYFTAGNIGGIAGYWDYPSSNPNADLNNGFGREGYDGFDSCMDPNIPFDYSLRNTQQPNSVPHWLTQQIVLSQAQAEFSWLEPFLRNGDLLPGDGVNHYSADQPSYEFNTGYADTRVLARKMKTSNEWILTAWAADGVTRNVNVTVPGLGTVSLNAVPAAHVYYAKLNGSTPSVTQIDTDPLNPTPSAKTLWDTNVLPHS